ncbi:MAG: endopeptidase La [Pseudomonadota bacterium]
MDIDHEAKPQDDEGSGQIILPGSALPGIIQILPQDNRPFFPGQAVPLLMSAEAWLPTLKQVQEREQEVIGVLATREPTDGTPSAADCFDMGTVCRIHRVQREGEQLHVLLEGIERFQVRRWLTEEPPLAAQVRYFPTAADVDTSDAEVKAYAVAIINIIKELIPLNPLYGEELKVFLARSNPNQPSLLADFAATMTTASKADLQKVLETLDLKKRLPRVVELLHKEVQIAKAQMEIREHVEQEIQSHQRESILRQQLQYIQKELGITKDDKTADVEQFRGRLEDLTVPEDAQARIDDELNKLSVLEPGSPEYGLTRNYLDWLTSMPWGSTTPDNADLKHARQLLDEHHEGLGDVKERLLEFLALGLNRGDVAGSIICLAGPPGVGKTSLGKATAEALGRQFYRFSVGGMRDEAEIKGHRRTYIGAMPGKLIQALKDTGSSNPVILLDEIDKIGVSYQGDPASALLEVLDPEQNSSFRDHYLDLPVDLSKVLFICTANQLDTIPGPLLDRMEVIRLSGYLEAEKLAIARKHLLPKHLDRAGMKRRGELSIQAPALRRIVSDYAREAGVRRLEKHLAALVRKACVKLLDGAAAPIRIGADDLEDYLGQPPFNDEALLSGIGIITGLAYTAAGGATLGIEAAVVHNRSPSLRLTGQLGDVMQESANIAYSYVSAHAEELGADPDFFARAAIHLHVPAGATPKDGPSAGIAIASALLSLALDRAPAQGWAMTGELTLTGQVYPIGGLKEKLLAARRQQIKSVIVPRENERDVKELAPELLKGIRIHYAREFEDVANQLFKSKGTARRRSRAPT